MESFGNSELLKLRKTAFLCSRQAPAGVVLKCYDWAIEQREKGNSIISGFHSRLEKDVLHHLLKGSQPLIIALARGLKERVEPEFKQALQQGRLLMITPFSKETKRVTIDTAEIRNRFMMELADEIMVAYAKPGGSIEKLLREFSDKKKIKLLN